jgi:hypothetical protein
MVPQITVTFPPKMLERAIHIILLFKSHSPKTAVCFWDPIASLGCLAKTPILSHMPPGPRCSVKTSASVRSCMTSSENAITLACPAESPVTEPSLLVFRASSDPLCISVYECPCNSGHKTNVNDSIVHLSPSVIVQTGAWGPTAMLTAATKKLRSEPVAQGVSAMLANTLAGLSAKSVPWVVPALLPNVTERSHAYRTPLHPLAVPATTLVAGPPHGSYF